MSKTTNYQLTVWDYGDEDFTPGRVREDLAENFTALDRVLKAEEQARTKAVKELSARAEVVTGFYTGDDAPSRTISLGFTPKAVLLMEQCGKLGGTSVCGGLALTGHPGMANDRQIQAVGIVAGGFAVTDGPTGSGSTACNAQGRDYHYLALR